MTYYTPKHGIRKLAPLLLHNFLIFYFPEITAYFQIHPKLFSWQQSIYFLSQILKLLFYLTDENAFFYLGLCYAWKFLP